MLARELHDELGQAVTSLRMDLAMLRRDLPGDGRDLHRRVDEMIQLADETIVLIRSISSRLRPPALDVLGLPAAVEWLVEEIEPRTEMVFDLDLEPESSALGRDASTAVFRIVQEGLTNVVRHSEAQRVEIRMEVREGEVVVDVRDDGVGVPPGILEGPGSLGLTGMFERAEALGGSLEVGPDVEGGTRVSLSVPLSHGDRSR
ncbi:sensor histidine kinase [Gemmatimonadota bacterium]